MKQIIWFLIVFLGFAFSLEAQSDTPLWEDIAEERIEIKGERQIIPTTYRTLELNNVLLQSILANVPLRFSQEAQENVVYLTLPLYNGEWASFKITEAPIMSKALANKFPELKTYTGICVDEPQWKVRLDWTKKGFHAMLYTPEGSMYIDPYSAEDKTHYISYHKKDFHKPNDTWHCTAETPMSMIDESTSLKSMAGDCDFRSYRLAVAATGEYTQYHGGSVSDGMSAIVTAMNRVIGVYEKEIAVTFELVDDNDELIYTNSSSDPYSNNDGFGMLSQNHSNLNSVIGSSSYDIGHVFSTGGGGVAFWGSVCSSVHKGKGVTGLPNPIGDSFYIDFVSHEMGHQFGASHCFNNFCQENRYNPTAMEPGSGSTIMAYAGVCPPNVQNNSDDYFHAISLQEIATFVTNNGDNCANVIATNNTPPTANAGVNYKIPHSTPFTLSGTASDADGDPLTYCWEQMDNDISTQPPLASNDDGPSFRSYDPVSIPERNIPKTGFVVNNNNNIWEVLTTEQRTFNFRFTVRDNNDGYGCTDEDNMTVTSYSNSGPFLVTNPNTFQTWTVGESINITWDPANTQNGPINCEEVDILLSTNSGYEFSIVLASGTNNDGSATITVPDYVGTSNRVKVVCSDNIFYDMSNTNFAIEAHECMNDNECDDDDPCTLDNCVSSTGECENIFQDEDNDNVCDFYDICPNGDDNIDSDDDGIPDACDNNNLTEVRLDVKVLLEGAYDGSGQMHTTLNDNNLLPLEHPYGVAPYNISENPNINILPNDMVDWVIIELRSGSNSDNVILRKVALLMSDGDVKDMNGVDDLRVDIAAAEDYYIIIRHRNHLDIITALPINHSSTLTYDFTGDTDQALSNKQADLGDGRAAMFVGDNTQDLIIQLTDFDLWKANPAQINVYSPSDFTMDGVVQVTDFDAWAKNKAIIAPPELAY